MVRPELITALNAVRPMDEIVSGSAAFDGDDPTVIRVATPQELGRLVAEAYTVFDQVAPDPVVEEVVRHEGQHGHASLLLGARAVDYALRFFGDPRPDGSGADNIQFVPMTTPDFGGTQSELRDLAVAAYPQELSVADTAFISALGYVDSEEVAAHIRQVNAETGLNIPVPLSVLDDRMHA